MTVTLPFPVFDYLTEGIILLDQSRCIQRINATALLFLGLTIEQALQQPFEGILDLPSGFFEPTQIISQLRLPLTLGKQQEYRECELMLHPFEEGWLLVLTNVTFNKRLSTLEDRLTYLEAILSTTPDFFFILDPSSHLLYASPSVLALTNLELKELVGRSWQELGFSNREGLQFADNLNRVFSEGISSSSEHTITAGENKLHFELIISPHKSPSGRVTLAVTTMRDITNRRRMEDRMRESREMYRSLINASPDAIVVANARGEVTIVSPKAYTIFNIQTNKQLIGTPLLDWIALEDRDRAQLNFDLFLRGMDSLADKETRYWVLKEDGTRFIGEITVSSLNDATGQPSGLIALVRDVSDRELARTNLRDVNVTLTRANAELKSQNEKVSLLSELGKSLLACDTIESACQILANTSVQLFPGQAGAIYLNHSNKERLSLVSAWGQNPAMEDVINIKTCQAIQQKSSRFFCVPQMIRQRALSHSSGGPNEGPQVCFPLVVRGEVIGIFQLHGQSSGVYDTWIQLAHSAADQFALTVTNLRLRDSLHTQAIRDPLTGLYNRRHMEESLGREISRAARHGHSVGIIMMDIDFFKSFNDSYLHDGGDALLQRLGRYLRAHIRGEDIACRYGGEEFTLILPETSLDDTLIRAEYIRKGVNRIRITHRGVKLRSVTISAGVAVYPTHGASGAEVLRVADAALYKSKQAGRNRTSSPVD